MVAAPLRGLTLRQHHRVLAFVEVAQGHQTQGIENVVYFSSVRSAVGALDTVEKPFNAPGQVTLRGKLGIRKRGFHTSRLPTTAGTSNASLCPNAVGVAMLQ
jgi:hypothetical protein